MRHVGALSGIQAIKDQDDMNPEETEELRAEEEEYKVKLSLGGVLLGLVRLLIVCILVTATIVFLTSLIVIGSKVGLGGFVDFTVGLITGYYALLLPGDVLALRGSLELIMFFEFLFLLLVGLFMVASLRLGGEGSPRTFVRMRGRPGFPPVGRSQNTEQKIRRKKARGVLGVEVVFLLVALFIALTLLFGFV